MESASILAGSHAQGVAGALRRRLPVGQYPSAFFAPMTSSSHGRPDRTWLYQVPQAGIQVLETLNTPAARAILCDMRELGIIDEINHRMPRENSQG